MRRASQKKKASMPGESDLATLVRVTKEAADKSREDIATLWNECADLVRCKQDYSKKKNWQHKVFSPEAGPAVRKGKSIIKQVLLKSRQPFEIEADDKEKASANYEAVEFVCAKNDFPELIADVSECCFTMGPGILKIYPELAQRQRVTVVEEDSLQPGEEPGIYQETTESVHINMELKDPRLCWWADDDSFFIEEQRTTVPRLLEMARRFDWDMTKVRRIIREDYSESDKERDRRERLGLVEHTDPYRKHAQIDHFWGDIIDKDTGDVVARNWHLVVVNEKWVVKSQANPFWHGKYPYVLVNPLKVLFRHIGASMIEGVKDIQKAINNWLNCMLDQGLFSLLAPYELNLDALVSKDSLPALAPGRPILKRGKEPVITKADLSSGIKPEAFELLHTLRQSFQNGTGVTDFIMGRPTAKGNPTLGEVQLKTQESGTDFESIAKEIETQAVVPAVEMVRALIFQFMGAGANDPISAIFAKHGIYLEAMDEAQRIQVLEGDYTVKARGISIFFERMQTLQQLTTLLQTVGNTPAFLERLKTGPFLEKLIENLFPSSVEANDLVLSDDEFRAEQQQKMQVAQALQQAQAGVPGLGGPQPTPGLPGAPQGPALAPPGMGMSA